jgi:hypothetical protein
MTQDDLDVHHKSVCDAVQLWADGLITDLEFSVLMAEDRKALPANANPAGLIDPNTGLLYPAKSNSTKREQEPEETFGIPATYDSLIDSVKTK